MGDIETLKAEIKKLSAKAMQLKMDLHDLSEELPQNWPSIPDVARRTFEAFSELDSKRAELKTMESALTLGAG
ncbi:MAG TPA: CCE_0567 family metalloprotein [Polyangiaceae bacterium]|nr:CCE_0567 family metalloprotein [Polyangiaceae bacterium]